MEKPFDPLSFDAYFFDFDGLLVDTESIHYKAYQILLARRGLSLSWDFTTYCSHAHQSTEYFASLMYSLFPSLYKEQSNWMILREEKQAIYTDLISSSKVDLMPGVEQFLLHLHRHKKPLYVVTNSPLSHVTFIRKEHPVLNMITKWVTREDFARAKPAPDGYLKALALHGDPNCKTVGFEDALKGLQALKASPIEPVLILPPQYPPLASEQLTSVKVFNSFLDISLT